MDEANQYIGKHLLVGLTYVDEKGEVIRKMQLHGEITRITETGIFFERADGGGEFSIPPVFDALKPASPGEYQLKTTGEVVKDPDYTSVWTIKSDAPPS